MSFEVIMPALGMAQDTGLLVAWHKAPGDAVVADDILMEVETDKSTMEVPAGFAGFIAELRASEGENVPVGNVIAIITTDKPTGAAIQPQHAPTEPMAATPELVTPTPVEQAVPDVEIQTAIPMAAGDRIFASPKAKRLAYEAGLDLSELVTAGVPQPFRAADIETLRNLPSTTVSPAATSETISYGPAVSQITARVPCGEFDAFVGQMAKEGGIDLNRHVIWASFAAASLRGNIADQSIVVEIQDGSGSSAMHLLDPDRIRLSTPQMAPDGQAPSLVIRDLTGSRITGMTIAAESAPALSVNKTEMDFELGFAFSEQQMSSADAFEFVSQVADRLENPLIHLV